MQSHPWDADMRDSIICDIPRQGRPTHGRADPADRPCLYTARADPADRPCLYTARADPADRPCLYTASADPADRPCLYAASADPADRPYRNPREGITTWCKRHGIIASAYIADLMAATVAANRLPNTLSPSTNEEPP
jgi:hypothetical protein